MSARAWLPNGKMIKVASSGKARRSAVIGGLAGAGLGAALLPMMIRDGRNTPLTVASKAIIGGLAGMLGGLTIGYKLGKMQNRRRKKGL